jgi:PAS domain-containing protein
MANIVNLPGSKLSPIPLTARSYCTKYPGFLLNASLDFLVTQTCRSSKRGPKPGAVSEVTITFQDITKIKRAEEALGKSEERLRLALQRAGGGAWDLDLESGEAWWSPDMYKL